MMKPIITVIGLAVVVGVGVWAIVMLSGPGGPVATAPPTDRNAQGPVQSAPVGGSFDPAVRLAGDWPIFRGSPDLRGVAAGGLPDSLRLVWKYQTGGPILSSAAIGDGKVFVASGDGNAYALDLIDGRKLWSFPTGKAVNAPPLLLDGVVFVGSTDSFLYAIDAGTGRRKWKYKTGAQITGSANWARRPKAGGTCILVGSYDRKLHCVDASDGGKIWTYETEHFINGAPAVAEGKAVFGNCDGIIYVVSVADGQEAGKIKVGGPVVGSAALVGRRAYLGHHGNEFVCADLAEGQIVWRYAEMDGAIMSSPAVGRSRVVFGSRDKRVHCVDRNTGERIWVFVAAGGVDSSPVICGDKVIVGGDDGRVYLLRLSDGEQLWSYEIGRAVTASPAVAAPVVIVGSEDGVVYAFGPR